MCSSKKHSICWSPSKLPHKKNTFRTSRRAGCVCVDSGGGAQKTKNIYYGTRYTRMSTRNSGVDTITRQQIHRSSTSHTHTKRNERKRTFQRSMCGAACCYTEQDAYMHINKPSRASRNNTWKPHARLYSTYIFQNPGRLAPVKSIVFNRPNTRISPE